MIGSRPIPKLSPDQATLWKQGLKAFNKGAFFEAHEYLEDLWRSDFGQGHNPALKTGLQGLIQLAVACVHLQRGNPKGAQGVLARAEQNLRAGELPQGQTQMLQPAISAWQNWLAAPQAERGPQPPWPQFLP